MRFFRLHTIRLTALLILASGLGPFLFSWQSAEAQNHEFAKWLTKLAKEDVKDRADEKIRKLDTSGDLIREATDLISSHSEWFSLPLDENSDLSDEEVYELIKKEWVSYQQGSTMSGEKAIERHNRPGWTPEKHYSLDYNAGITKDVQLPARRASDVHLYSGNGFGDSSPELPAIVIRGP